MRTTLRTFFLFAIASVLAACSGYDAAWVNSSAALGDAAVDDTVGDVVPPPDDATTSDTTVSDVSFDVAPPDGTVVDAPSPDATSPDAPIVDVRLPDVVPPDVPVAPRCGDRTCNGGETCTTCPADCGACDACLTGTTCGACTPMANCGWCRPSNRCLRGTGSGSTDGSCSGTNWAWQTADCMVTTTDPCARFNTCNSCAMQATCGWCASSNRCVTGNDHGPTTGTCSRWVPFVMMCGG